MSSPNPSTESTMQVIEAQRQGEDALSFTLPVNPADISKIEAVDLDLLLTTADGQQFILPQGALLAMTQPNSAMRFANGEESLASDAIKRVGVLKPVENGSFRLAGLDIESLEPEQVQGTGFGLGQEIQDVVSKLDTSSQRMEQILQTLDQVTQASPVTKGDEPPPSTQTGVKRTTKLADPNPFASPTPGAPPKPENTNTSDNDALPNVTFTLLAANKEGVTHQGVALGKTEVRQLLGKTSVELNMNPTAQNLIFEQGKVENQLLLESVPTTTALLININNQQPGFKIPEGLTINGQAITPGTPLSLDVTGMKDNEVPLNLKWKEGTEAAASTFQMTVSYVGPKGETTLKTITFTGKVENAYTLDANGDLRQFITSLATDLVVKANNLANTITTGNGDDTIFGSGGADTINGSGGNDTVDYSASLQAISIDVVNGVGEGGDADGDRLISIEHLIGSSTQSNIDALDFSQSEASVKVDFVQGTTKVGYTNVGVSFSGFEKVIGSAHGDTYVVNNTQFGISESADGLGVDTVQASVDYTLGEHLENLELTGTAVNGTGNASNNTITGNSGNNRLDGGEGTDGMSGGAGNDTYVVDNTGDVVTENLNAGIDTIEASVTYTLSDNVENLTLTGTTAINGNGNGLTNRLTANNQGNTLNGGAGNDTLIGGDGNDTLNGGTDADSMSGGKGDDLYIVDSFILPALDIVTELQGEGTDTVQASVSYTLSGNVENLTLTGTTAINGTGNSLDNTILGNSANNQLDGGAGADTMAGGSGNDTYVVDNDRDVVTEESGAGIDIINASVTYTLSANVENLTLTGNAAINGAGNDLANTLRGNSADNRLDGGAGVDTMFGGAGNDTYVVDNPNDVVREASGEGTDTVQSSVTYALSVNVENLTLTETTAINGTGNTLANILNGNSADNRLDGGTGADTMVGGAGNDTYIVDNTGDVVTESENAGTDTIESSATYTLSDNVENLTLTGTAAINGTGNSLDNTILGNSADNTLVGGAGNDTLNGGTGIDTASFVVTTAAVIATLGLNGLNGSASGDGSDVLISIENLLGGNGNDTLNGNEQANRLEGAAGDDILNGGAANDTLIGGDGNDQLNGEEGDDTIFGSAGADTINGGNGIDTASYTGSDAGVTIRLGNGTDTVTASGGHAQGDKLSNIENLIGSSSHGDTLTGNNGVNRIEGGGGNDTLNGGGGSDTLLGGTGDDTYIINNSGLTITEVSGEGNDTVISSVNDYTLGANLENLTLSGTATKGTGNNLDNLITGNGTNNHLIGGVGNDTLVINATGIEVLEAGSKVIKASGLNAGTYDGGSNTDTLKILASAGATIDLRGIDTNKFISIEALDLSAQNNNTLKLDLKTIQDLVDNTSGTPTLSVKLGMGDTIEFVASAGQTTLRTSNEITIFSNSGTTLTELANITLNYA